MSDLMACSACDKVIDSFDYCGNCDKCYDCCTCIKHSYNVTYHTDIKPAMNKVIDYLKDTKAKTKEVYDKYMSGSSDEYTDWLYGQMRLRERMIKLAEDIISDAELIRNPDEFFFDTMKGTSYT